MSMSRTSALIAATCVFVLALAGATLAASRHHAPAKHTHMHGLSAPRLLSPARGASVQQLPALTWGAVNGAIDYQFQVAADSRFRSLIAVSATAGKGTPSTHNLAAALEKPVTDGTYYWRVRAVSSGNRPGPWSAAGRIVKRWSQAPVQISPSDRGTVPWPSTPLVLRWTAVPSATEYLVKIATDPALSNIVLGSATKPEKTWATAFAVPGALQAGQTYYWAVTPVDTLGHRGTVSSTRSFTPTWNSATSTTVNPLNAQLGETELNWTPELTWQPVAGAARYEVEVSSAEGYPAGSKWCCERATIGTASYTPPAPLNNNEYYWRVRAIDSSGNAGQWNEGPRFRKGFDNTTPTIPSLSLADVHGNPLPAGSLTETPIVTWSPVPGAGSYEVQLAPYEEGGGYCNWSHRTTDTTATLAWTPLGPGHHAGQLNWPAPQSGSTLAPGGYCLMVAARSDKDAFGNQIEGVPTQLGGAGNPAFVYAGVKEEPGPPVPRTPASAYLLPTNQSGALRPTCTPWIAEGARSACPRTPLFTWSPVPGASSYDVVVARDRNFTNVVDVGSTEVTAYAPQIANEEPLDDETTQYYWAVLPVNSKGQIGSTVQENEPQQFDKSSIAPEPISVTEEGAALAFKWHPAEGAVSYTVEVAEDATFANLIDPPSSALTHLTTTSSTAYTSSATYPAHKTLYWRVRANDARADEQRAGLRWSPTQTFTRTLPSPVPLASNLSSGEDIPVWSWTPVVGAVGYGIHVEQPDGKSKDFTSQSSSFTFIEWDGPGIWRWQARALYPTTTSATVAGGYFAPQPFAHTFGPPPGTRGVKSGSRIVISWNPQAYANAYQVAISTTETFKSTISSHKVETTSWAPDVDFAKKANKGTLYWRVGAVDNKGNVGPYATGKFVPPCKTKRVKRKGKTVSVCVKSKHKPAKKKHG
jgi:hypothetical protein